MPTRFKVELMTGMTAGATDVQDVIVPDGEHAAQLATVLNSLFRAAARRADRGAQAPCYFCPGRGGDGLWARILLEKTDAERRAADGSKPVRAYFVCDAPACLETWRSLQMRATHRPGGDNRCVLDGKPARLACPHCPSMTYCSEACRAEHAPAHAAACRGGG